MSIKRVTKNISLLSPKSYLIFLLLLEFRATKKKNDLSCIFLEDSNGRIKIELRMCVFGKICPTKWLEPVITSSSSSSEAVAVASSIHTHIISYGAHQITWSYEYLCRWWCSFAHKKKTIFLDAVVCIAWYEYILCIYIFWDKNKWLNHSQRSLGSLVEKYSYSYCCECVCVCEWVRERKRETRGEWIERARAQEKEREPECMHVFRLFGYPCVWHADMNSLKKWRDYLATTYLLHVVYIRRVRHPMFSANEEVQIIKHI